MIRYSIVKPKNIKKGLLNGYKRFTETQRVKLFEDGELIEKELFFIDEWDQEKLTHIEEYMTRPHLVSVLAKEGSQVVGFAILDTNSFGDYMNMPYLHADNRYRSKGIGTNLLLMISREAKNLGAKKLYISAHPDVRAQAFYEKMGCVLAKEINQELFDLEPYDIQLERVLDDEDIMMRKISYEFLQHKHISSTLLNKLLPRIYKFMPEDDLGYIQSIKPLLISDSRSYFSMGTLLLKKKASVIDEKYLEIYTDILLNHIHDWGQVDQYCYRVLGPIFNRNYNLFHILNEWSMSDNKDVRRASLVSMLISEQKITCTYPLDKVMFIVERLKNDTDFHVKKAVGWVLKCAYVTYPDEVVKYLKKHKESLNRIIFRYALEHMDSELKKELMKK